MLTYKGRILKINVIVKNEKRQDFQSPYSYCGYASEGSSESSPVWTITRMEVFLNGTIDSKTATNVAWSNRYSATYI